MDRPRLGVLGATSLVGECLLPLLSKTGWPVTAFSRRATERVAGDIEWRRLNAANFSRSAAGSASPQRSEQPIPLWLCAAPVWTLVDYLDFLAACGARRIVALSSTSRFTKDQSSDSAEQVIARKLASAEDHFRAWAEKAEVEWVVLRPTLIYGRGRDKNICEIARFIRRFGFFPLLGPARGLRQPLHVEDLAVSCLAAVTAPDAANRAYDLSGGETLPYREMVRRIFVAMGRRPRLLTVPPGVLRIGVTFMRQLPRSRHWSPAMAERMNRDLVFDHVDAVRDLAFAPRPFRLTRADLDAGLVEESGG